jgi:uncharacterized RDD family membrane protein YckC
MNQELLNATFLRRLGAMMYDSLLLLALLIIAALPVVFIAGPNSAFFKSPLYTLYLYSISFVFFGWFWTRGGQTLGMRSWKIRVLRNDNRPLGWDSALMRYLLATISLTLFGLGFIWILFDKDRLAWHDQLSRTHILHDPAFGKKTT